MYIVKLVNGKITTEIHGEVEKLKSGNVIKGINTIDSFSFAVLPSNAGFNQIFDFQTLVTVFNTNRNRYEFLGRVLHSEASMESDGLISKEVVCESYFGFFCDSQQTYVAEKNWTVTGLLQHIIDVHNSQVEEYKHFAIGEVTVTDPNDNLYVGIQRENTWKTIEEKLIKKLGGEIRFRVVDGVIYLDYLTEIGQTKATKIALSRNMKSISKESDPSAYITRLIPLGAKLSNDTEERLDITSVNNGKNYIDDTTAIETYGIHVGYVEFDDVTVATTLLSKGRNWLADNNKVQIKYSITALDLSLIGLEIDDFDVHNYHPIENALLGIDDVARIIKKNVDVREEVLSTIEVGDNFKTLSDIQQEQLEQIKSASQNLQVIQSATNNLKSEVSSTKESLEQIKGQVEDIEGLFFYIRYSAYSDGHVMTTTPQTDTLYMGTCSTSEQTAPTDYTKYTWCRVKGDQGEQGIRGEQGIPGIPGEPGSDGKTQYLHIKYSDDGKTFTANNGETLGAYIGTLVDFNEADSTTFSDYTWKKFTEDVDDELEEIRKSITETKTEVLNDCNEIILKALKNYVETGNYDSFKESVETTLRIVAGQIDMNFKTTTEEIANVDGDLQAKFNEIYKYIRFVDGSIVLGSSESAITLTIENDMISFKKNGVQFGYWDGDDFHTGNIVVEVNERAQFGNFAFIPREDGSLSFLKVR